MADKDYSTLSDEELERQYQEEVLGNKASPTPGVIKSGFAKDKGKRGNPATPIAEEIEPSAAKRFVAGLGGAMLEPIAGAAEKVQLAFPGEGDVGRARIAQVGSERDARRNAMRQLEETPAGQAGAFIGDAAPFVAGPARIPAQMAIAGTQGFLRGGPDKPTGITGELASSALRAGTEAATTGAMMKLGQYGGRAVNAAASNYSPAGRRMMDTDAAAQRLGLTGETAPSVRQLALNVPESAEQIGKQADTLRGTLSTTRQVPAAVGRGTEEQTIPGGVLREELSDAVRTRMAQGTAKYAAVDDFAAANNLAPVTPIYSVPQLSNMQKGAVKGDEASLLAVNMMAHANPESLQWFGNALANGLTTAQIKAQGLPLSTYHEMRVAAGKAIGNLDRVNSANKTATQWRAQKLLTDLRDGLDNEAEVWARKNAGNAEAMNLYNNAKSFYRDVVAPAVLENPLARKATTRKTPWATAEDMYTAVTNPKNEELLARLDPTMGPVGKDVVQTLRGLPDIGQAMATRRAPNAPVRGGLELANVASALRGHPLAAATSFLPGLGSVGRSQTAKRLYASKDPFDSLAGRPMAGALQYPQNETENWLERLLAQRPMGPR